MPPSSHHDTDEIDRWIAACLEGDQQAWSAIVRRYWRKAFNVAYTFVGRHEEAEDLTQEIFLRVYKALGTFDRRANFQTWLISISRNLCIDHYRKVRRERETVDRYSFDRCLNDDSHRSCRWFRCGGGGRCCC